MAKPIFIQAPHGRLFAMYYPPQIEQPVGLILHVPAFAEEMNKSRRMVALQAAKFSYKNYGVLVLDLLGTGDSEGLLENASWQIWLDDIAEAVVWLQQQYSHVPLYLWGLRFGCALALGYAAQQNSNIQSIILWQPILSAKMMLTQFLRLRVAAALTSQSSTEKTPETTKSLFQQLENGSSVEVGGYMLSPGFSASLLEVDAGQMSFNYPQSIFWFDFVTGNVEKPSPVNHQVISRWVEQNSVVKWEAVNGDRFWSTQEIALCPELITLTTRCVTDR